MIEKQLLRKNYERNVSECKKLRTLIKVWLRETLLSFQKKNTIIPGFNMEKLLMIIKFQTVIMQYMMFIMYTTIIKFLFKIR